MENHNVTLENRSALKVTQVSDVDAFDEQTVKINLANGAMIIKGQNLNIERLALDEGEIRMTGRIDSMYYTEKGKNREKFIKKILK